MSDTILPDSEVSLLRSARFTYPEVGHSLDNMPSGYHHLRRRVVVGTGTARFTEAAKVLLAWQMHRKAGVSVRASSEPLVEGASRYCGLVGVR